MKRYAQITKKLATQVESECRDTTGANKTTQEVLRKSLISDEGEYWGHTIFEQIKGEVEAWGYIAQVAKKLIIWRDLATHALELTQAAAEVIEADRRELEALRPLKQVVELLKPLKTDLETAAKSGAAHGAKSGVAKSLPPLMRKLATSDDPDPLAPKKRAPGAGRPRKHDLDGKQVKDAYERMAENPEAQSFTAICANLIRNPPKRRKYQKPYKSAKALFNAVKRAHPDLSDLRP